MTSRYRPAREAIHRRWGRLDVLVAAAGALGPLTPLHHVDPKQWDDVMAINVTANWRLVRALDPLLRQSPAGRAVFVTRAPRAARSCAPIGPLRRLQGGARRARAHLRRRDDQHLGDPRHAGQSRSAEDPHARRAMPGEDPMTLRAPENSRPRSSRSAPRNGPRPASSTTSRTIG